LLTLNINFLPKADITYLPYNRDEVFEKFTDNKYMNLIAHGTNREGDEVEIRYKLSNLI